MCCLVGLGLFVFGVGETRVLFTVNSNIKLHVKGGVAI